MADHPTSILLSRPFPPDEVLWVPVTVAGFRALVAPYIDVRSVQDRLDKVLGPARWEDYYRIVRGQYVLCQLSLLIDDTWITKCDIGAADRLLLTQAKQEASWRPRWFGRRHTDEPTGQLLKAAFSDALKRAAVKFGIGRYLGRCCKVWVDWDPAERQIVQCPAAPVLNGKSREQPHGI